jgi:hypothetical protein
LAFNFRASLAEIALSSFSDHVVLDDLDLNHPNFRLILDVADKLLSKIPAAAPPPGVLGVDITLPFGLTLQTTMESFSSSSVTSTNSSWLFLLRSFKKIGNIAPPISQSLAVSEPSRSSSGKSNVRL